MKQTKCLHSELYQKKTNPGNSRNAQQVQNVTWCRPDSLVQSQNTHSRRTGREKKTFHTNKSQCKEIDKKTVSLRAHQVQIWSTTKHCCDCNSENMATTNNPTLPQKSTMFSLWWGMFGCLFGVFLGVGGVRKWRGGSFVVFLIKKFSCVRTMP